MLMNSMNRNVRLRGAIVKEVRELKGIEDKVVDGKGGIDSVLIRRRRIYSHDLIILRSSRIRLNRRTMQIVSVYSALFASIRSNGQPQFSRVTVDASRETWDYSRYLL